MSYNNTFLAVLMSSLLCTISGVSYKDCISKECNSNQEQAYNNGKEVLQCAYQIYIQTTDNQRYARIFKLFEFLDNHHSDEIAIDVQDEHGRTALSYLMATPYSLIKCLVDFFIHKYQANIHQADCYGITPFEYLLKDGSSAVLEYVLHSLYLLKNIQKFNSSTTYDVSDGQYSYINFLPVSDTSKVIIMLENSDSARQNYKVMQRVIEYYKNYPNQHYFEQEFEKIVKVYFSSSVTVQSRDFNLLNIIYDIALDLAYSINFKRMAEILFEYADSLNQQNELGETPGHIFVKNAVLASAHFFEVLDVFKKHGANFTEIKDFAQKTVYYYIVKKVAEYLTREEGVQEVSTTMINEYLKRHNFNIIS